MTVELRSFIPVEIIYAGAIVTLVILVAGLAYRFARWRRVEPPNTWGGLRGTLGLKGIIGYFLRELVNRVILQREVIQDDRPRWLAHFTVFWGFVGTAIATTLLYIYNPGAAPRPLTDPAKVIGNIGGALLLIGGTIIIVRLAVSEKFRRRRTFTDTLFLVLLYAATVTGFLTQFARLSGEPGLAYANYTVHIAAVVLLLASAPFTQFVHALSAPALRYLDRIQSVAVLRSKVDYKEAAVLKQVQLRVQQTQTPSKWLNRHAGNAYTERNKRTICPPERSLFGVRDLE